MASSVDKVLGNYELLEHILLDLPMKKLFVVQRVSPTWEAMIRRSKSIQKKMFLYADCTAPEPPLVAHEFGLGDYYEYEASSIQLNPALVRRCGSLRDPDDLLDRALAGLPKDNANSEEIDLPGSTTCEWVKESIALLTLHPAPYTRPTDGHIPTYRAMFLTMPPITVTQFEWFDDDEGNWKIELRNSRGLNFGDLMDSNNLERANHEASQFIPEGGTFELRLARRGDVAAGSMGTSEHWCSKEKLCPPCNFLDTITAR